MRLPNISLARFHIQLDSHKVDLIKKAGIVLVIGVLLAEAVWAYQTLSRLKIGSEINNSSVVDQISSVTLSAFPTKTKVREQIVVTINLSANKMVDGTDVILNYDPQKLELIPNAQNQPVTTGTLFNDYPMNIFDQTKGEIAVSGITNQPAGVLAKGELGKITFLAKQPGQTEIKILFQSGQTTETNLTEHQTATDILREVKGVELIIE